MESISYIRRAYANEFVILFKETNTFIHLAE